MRIYLIEMKTRRAKKWAPLTMWTTTRKRTLRGRLYDLRATNHGTEYRLAVYERTEQ